MNFSAPFIHRPIATALLMAGLLLCGLATYPLLPVAALPERQLPDHPGHRPVARRRSADHGVVGRDAAGAAAEPDSRRHAAHLGQRARRDRRSPSSSNSSRTVDSAAVGRAGGDQRRKPLSADEHSLPADDPKGESGRDADHAARAHVGYAAADHRRCLCGKHPAAQDFADSGRRPGRHRRPAEARHPRPGQSAGAGRPRHRPGRRPQRDRPGQRRSAKGHAQQPARRPTRSTPTTSCSNPTPTTS